MPDRPASDYSRHDLPDPGEGRYWLVEHHATNERTPVTIKLMSETTPKRRALGELVGFARTTASWKALAEAAELVLARVGDVDALVGTYGAP